MTDEPIGLLAGWGRFPLAFAAKARSVGRRVVCVGLRHEASPELAPLVDCFYWSGLARLGRTIRCFKREGVRRIVMAGKVHKANYLYKPWRMLTLLPDWRGICFWLRRRKRPDNRDNSLVLDVIDEFGRDGLCFDSALDLCPELLVNPGVLTRRKPSAAEQADVTFGWDIARKMGELDVGQSVMVKDRTVVAVEAIEGTDRAICRAGELSRGGFVVVKVAKPEQDMRFDVPTVGRLTIQGMIEAGGRVLAVEGDRTIFLDREETIALANRHGISIVAMRAAIE